MIFEMIWLRRIAGAFWVALNSQQFWNPRLSPRGLKIRRI
jgi:hypothetical protein